MFQVNRVLPVIGVAVVIASMALVAAGVISPEEAQAFGQWCKKC